jgi:protein-S-isoprenylcysteine O-methyltransferase Ste14
MSLVPVFELGMWNAWIFTLYLLSHSLLIRLIDKDIWGKMQSVTDETQKRIIYLSRAIRLFLLFYSFFLPLRVGTMWFYVGFPVCVLGSVMWSVAWVNFASTPFNEPVTKGLYRFSRHPMFLTALIVALGVSLASVSWLYLLLSLIGVFLRFRAYILPEERFCLEKYGDTYRKYLTRTPRWIGIPTSRKND